MVTESNGTGSGRPPAQELETFLPGSRPKHKEEIVVNAFKVRDPEAGDFDPFQERKNEHPTTDCDTLTHLLKAALGTGILAMPVAFKFAGLMLGGPFTILMALICTHCAYVLIKCAHILYHKTRRSTMSFSEVAELAFTHGPTWGRKYAYAAKIFVLVCLFTTYFGTCSAYTVIIAKNFKQVIDHHRGNEIDLRILITTLLIPLILLTWIPNLKMLAPVSLMANGCMGVGLGITIYYLLTDMPSLTTRPYAASPVTWPYSFSIVIFAMEAIGVVMPLENAMKTPTHLLGFCGVLNRGMSVVTMIYILLGFMGYVRYGDAVEGSITLNLPVDEYPAQAVKILIGLAVYATFALQFFVCIEICWNGIKHRFSKQPRLANYAMRTILVIIAVILAIAVPTIEPFIGLIGAFCFSLLGLIAPALIEVFTFWDIGFGPGKWVLWKNIVICIFGAFALIFGSKSAIADIIAAYTTPATN